MVSVNPAHVLKQHFCGREFVCVLEILVKCTFSTKYVCSIIKLITITKYYCYIIVADWKCIFLC